MEHREFNSGIDRLKATYGDRAYPPERIRALWNSVRNARPGTFESAVTYLIATERYAPMADKFRDAMRTRSTGEAAPSGPSCRLCGMTGFVATYDHHRTDYPKSNYRCTCVHGQRVSALVRQYEPREGLEVIDQTPPSEAELLRSAPEPRKPENPTPTMGQGGKGPENPSSQESRPLKTMPEIENYDLELDDVPFGQ